MYQLKDLMIFLIYNTYGGTFEVLTSYKDGLKHEGKSWFWPKVIWSSLWSLGGKCQIRVRSISFLGRTLELSTSQKDCWRPKDVSWFWSKVILASSKSLEGEAHSFFCLYTFLSKFLLNVKFVYDLRCHEPWISCTSLRSLFKNKSIFEI